MPQPIKHFRSKNEQVYDYLHQAIIQGDFAPGARLVIDELAEGENVEFRNFGVFQCVYRKPRVGRNPRRPEETVQIPGRWVIRFKPGKEMKTRLAKAKK